MEELVIDIDHKGCSFNELSKEFPELKMWHWCSRRVDVFEIHGRDLKAGMDRICEMAKSVGGNCNTALDKDGGRVILSEDSLCPCNRLLLQRPAKSLTSIIEEFYCMPLEPIAYFNGLERRRLISFDEQRLQELVARLEEIGEVKIVKKKKIGNRNVRDFFTISLGDLFAELSVKQYAALSDALRSGYFQVPRKISVGEISRRKSVPRTTFEEHLHKAQGKVMRALEPYLILYSKLVDYSEDDKDVDR